MKKLTVLGRYFFAISMIAFGVQHFVYLDFVTRIFPRPPALLAWAPGRSFLACVVGAFLVVTGAAIILRKGARWAALLLGAAVLVSFVLIYLPALIANPQLGGLWTSAGKALGLSGGAFLVAGSFTAGIGAPMDWRVAVRNALESFIPFARFFLGTFLILCGVQHFLYAEFVATLVPGWIPGHFFWTYFAGVALIAGGVGLFIGPTARLAAALSGVMIFLWVVLLHIPRAAADLHNANETTAVFEALAFSGTAFLAAVAVDARAKVAKNSAPPALRACLQTRSDKQ
jgi:uncharacterized membrane protein